MLFNYKYGGSSTVQNSSKQTNMSFAPDTLRQPTFFRGTLGKGIAFREAISALHDVVVSDLRYKPKDREEYKAWAAEQEVQYLAEMSAKSAVIKGKMQTLRAELNELNKESNRIMEPYYKARKKYFDYIYKKDRDAWFVLDPVITVHPDEVFFECFSQDESSYGRLGCSYEVFKQIDSFECGTTNIDYSDALYKAFQKIRSYKRTDFVIDPSGFQVETQQEDAYKEVKIDLPDSWVRGFLQVSAAMTLDAVNFELHPMDVHNFCFILRRFKAKTSPRYIRFKLEPGKPIQAIFEPWGYVVNCGRSIYKGNKAHEIKIWGRRRILILERLIPIAKKFTVHLLGTGLPSFYVADLGNMSFTLGLSGWTKNDWSRAGNFDLLAPRGEVDLYTQNMVFNALKNGWHSTTAALSKRMQLAPSIVASALAVYTQAGRVMYDLNKGVYRVRELSQDPLPLNQLRFANPQEASASKLLISGKVNSSAQALPNNGLKLTGRVPDGNTHIYDTELIIDEDQRLIKATCNCRFFKKNKLYKGPCQHILATRMHYSQNS